MTEQGDWTGGVAGVKGYKRHRAHFERLKIFPGPVLRWPQAFVMSSFFSDLILLLPACYGDFFFSDSAPKKTAV